MAYLGALGLEKEEYKDDRIQYDLIPGGEYLFVITKSGADENSKKTGIVLSTVLEVQEGEYAGSRILDTFNIQHENSQAEEIGRRQFRKLVESLGLPLTLNDSEKLHNIPVIGVVKVEKGTEKRGQPGSYYNDKSAVSYYKSAQEGFSQAPQPPVTQGANNAPGFDAPQAQTAAKKQQPWKKS